MISGTQSSSLAYRAAESSQLPEAVPRPGSVQAVTDVGKKLNQHSSVITPLSARDTLISTATNDIPVLSEDVLLYPENKVLFLKKVSTLIKEYGFQEGAQCLTQWPDNIKGQTWLHVLFGCLFDNPGTSMCKSVISGLEPQKNSTEAPVQAYLAVLNKLQEFNALQSPEGFQRFMNWLVRWKLSDVQPRTDLLMCIPDEYRKMRADFPAMDESGIKMAEDEGWGLMNPTKSYLAHTQWIQHYMICSLLEQAPVNFIEPVINNWLKNADTADIREVLFSQKQHPLSICFFEPRPWNILLRALERVTPQQDSRLRQELSQHDGTGLTPEGISSSHLTPFQSPSKPFVFGRTIASVDTTNKQENMYLKIQSYGESDEHFFREAQRIQYFHDNQERLELKSPALKLEGVFKSPSLKATLSQCALSDVDKAKALWKCSKEHPSDHYNKVQKDACADDYRKALFKAMNTHWHTLLEDDTPLPATKKQKLITHLLESDTHSNMMLLRSPAGYHNEKYVYDAEDPAEQLSGLARYLEEFGEMWYHGILGPDACSVFHDFMYSNGGRYNFLAPFFYHSNVGSVDQWSGTSTDFPNIGPEGIRDRGDSKTTSEQDIKTLFGRSGELESSDTLQIRAAQEALAKAAWGGILMYGRCFRENFDPVSPEKVTKVKDEIGRLRKAFNMLLPGKL